MSPSLLFIFFWELLLDGNLYTNANPPQTLFLNVMFTWQEHLSKIYSLSCCAISLGSLQLTTANPLINFKVVIAKQFLFKPNIACPTSCILIIYFLFCPIITFARVYSLKTLGWPTKKTKFENLVLEKQKTNWIYHSQAISYYCI